MYERFVYFLSIFIFLLSLFRPALSVAKDCQFVIKTPQTKSFLKLAKEGTALPQDASKDQTQTDTHEEEDYQDYDAILRQAFEISPIKAPKTNLWPRIIGALQDLVQSIHRPPSSALS